MRISLIVAMDRNRLIGAGNRLPWHLPADLAHFKRITLGKPIVMGRRTWESIGRPLPGRHNIVVTRGQGEFPGATRVASPEAAIAAAGEVDELMVIGGSQLYEAFLPLAERIYLTRVDAEFEGDAWFPELDPREWLEVACEPHEADERNPWPYAFCRLQRRKR